jgi:CBS domain-containing protein
MRVREIMATPVVTVREDCLLEEAAKLMWERKIGCLPVVDEHGELCGLISESDFSAKEKGVPFSLVRFPQVLGEWMPKEGVERIYNASRRTAASEIMSGGVVTLNEDDSVEIALEKMLNTRFHRLPVIRDRKPVGVLSRHDLLQLMLKNFS